MRSHVISIYLFACESWTLKAELEKKMQAFEMRCYRKLRNISHQDNVTNVRRKIHAAIGKYNELLTLIRKLSRYAWSSSLTKTILQDTVHVLSCRLKIKGKGDRRRGTKTILRGEQRWTTRVGRPQTS